MPNQSLNFSLGVSSELEKLLNLTIDLEPGGQIAIPVESYVEGKRLQRYWHRLRRRAVQQALETGATQDVNAADPWRGLISELDIPRQEEFEARISGYLIIKRPKALDIYLRKHSDGSWEEVPLTAKGEEILAARRSGLDIRPPDPHISTTPGQQESQNLVGFNWTTPPPGTRFIPLSRQRVTQPETEPPLNDFDSEEPLNSE